MADNVRDIEINIKIDTAASRKQIDDLSTKNKDLKKQLDDIQKTGQDGFNGLGNALKGLSSNFAAVGAVVGAIGLSFAGLKAFIGSAVDEAVRNEQAMIKLGQALRATGAFSDAAMRSFEAFKNELEATSIQEGEVIIDSLALAKSMGATNDEAKRLVQAAANLSSTFGGSLQDNTQKLAATLNGELARGLDPKKLGPLGREIQNLTKDQLALGAAIDLVNSKLGGAAAAEINSFAGSTNQLSKAWGDFLDVVGKLITQNQGVISFINTMAEGFNFLARQVDNLNFAVEWFFWKIGKGDEPIATTRQLEARFKDLNGQLNEAVERSITLQQQLASGFITQATIDKNDEVIQNLIAELDALKKYQDEVYKNTKGGGGGGGNNVDDKATIEARKTLRAELSKIDSEYLAQKTAQEEQLRLAKQAAEERDLEEELAYQTTLINLQTEQNIAKLEAEEQFQLDKAAINKTGLDLVLEQSKIAAATQLAISKEKFNGEMAIEKQREAMEKNRIANQRSTLGTIASLAQSNNKELAFIGKAAGITQIAIDTPVAISKALSAFPPPFNFAAAGAVGAAMAVQAAQIAGVKLADGGFNIGADGRIGGASFRGDKIPAYVNAGETVLNQREARVVGELMASGGGGNNIIMVELLQDIRNGLATPTPIYLNGVLLTEELNRVDNLRLEV